MNAQEHACRQLILCCDGTNNTFTGRVHDTNVLRLVDLLDLGATDQLLYYDPGVGAPDQMPATTAWDALSRKWARLQGLASGKGIYENVGSAYQFLIEHYAPGDTVFLFGFSRGAFTVRAVAGMVNLFGILQRHSAALIPTLLNVYFAKPEARGKRTRAAVATQIREQFGAPQCAAARIHFVGVWDTVASVGLPLLLETRITSDGFVRGKRMVHVRQALALDEHRASFRPRLYWENNGPIPGTDQTVEQRWFRGVHSDVGGGYRPPVPGQPGGQLSDQPFFWLLNEARAKGLRLSPQGVRACAA
ncbi:DUF2235 domain-containing protein [Oxalobacteraceae bacterium OM1]|nr:DUF2235 domain-containing protein [Oxalobacteraceae bacterium OM1]